MSCPGHWLYKTEMPVSRGAYILPLQLWDEWQYQVAQCLISFLIPAFLHQRIMVLQTFSATIALTMLSLDMLLEWNLRCKGLCTLITLIPQIINMLFPMLPQSFTGIKLHITVGTTIFLRWMYCWVLCYLILVRCRVWAKFATLFFHLCLHVMKAYGVLTSVASSCFDL